MERLLYKKKNSSGMHHASFSEGTLINNQPVKGKQVIRPGNTVYCLPAELGGAVDMFELLSPRPPEPDELPPGSTLELYHRGAGWYDVINPDNPEKPYNDKKLRKKDAEQLILDLTEGEGGPA